MLLLFIHPSYYRYYITLTIVKVLFCFNHFFSYFYQENICSAYVTKKVHTNINTRLTCFEIPTWVVYEKITHKSEIGKKKKQIVLYNLCGFFFSLYFMILNQILLVKPVKFTIDNCVRLSETRYLIIGLDQSLV